jgi:cytochrome b subunit of formate dehydrogenase
MSFLRECVRILRCAPLLGVLMLTGTSASADAPVSNSVCAQCHDVQKKVEKTAHNVVACATCHVKHEEYPHPANVPKPECKSCHTDAAAQFASGVHGEATRQGKSAPDCNLCHGTAHEVLKPSSVAFRAATLENCGMCHDQIATAFKQSIHGKAIDQGSTQAPVCSDCHGEHAIQRPKNPQSTVNAAHITETCGRCHGDVRIARKFNLPADRVSTFEASFHGLALKSGSLTAANCASCHGVHNILPSNDARSTINAKNLPNTCGKCHPGAGQRFALGPVHAWATRAEAPLVTWTRSFYRILIPLVLGFMLIHNFGDWARKLWQQRVKGVDNPYVISKEVRMLPAERWMHIALVLSFGVLTWTGFALIYPDQWWARPLLAFENKWPVRGVVHRTASVLFMLVTAGHAVSILRSRRLRRHWLGMLPKVDDARECAGTFAYNVGLSSRKPILSSHSYIEKMEYWAVVWGAVIMILTGAVLWANTLALHWLPKVVTDFATAIHFYEAVLAALAIVIWHFYFVFFDPDVYPMDTAWFTGSSIRKRPIGYRSEDHSISDEEESVAAGPPASTKGN